MSKNVIQSNIRTLRFMADEMTQQQLADEVETGFSQIGELGRLLLELL